MSISKLLMVLPFLLLPATAILPIVPEHHNVHNAPVKESNITIQPSDLCPLIQIVEHELCNTHAHAHNASPLSDLCVLLQSYNESFCSKHANDVKPYTNAALSVRTLENEFKHNDNHTHNIHDLCPIINFIDQELCASHNHPQFEFDPKQLCPLLNLTYTELCGSEHKMML